jgi:ABC-type microcin C transport system permease subunit YejE
MLLFEKEIFIWCLSIFMDTFVEIWGNIPEIFLVIILTIYYFIQNSLK